MIIVHVTCQYSSNVWLLRPLQENLQWVESKTRSKTCVWQILIRDVKRTSINRSFIKAMIDYQKNNRYLANNSPSFHPAVLVTVSIQRSILCEFWRSSHWLQRRQASWDVGFVTFSRHCLERYRWIHNTIVCTDDSHTDSLANDRLVY